MKHLLLALVLVCASAHAGYIDLRGGDIVEQTPCTKDGKQFLCVAVKKNDTLYLVILDRKGEVEIWTEKGLVWSRDSV